ncbi:hypothetical protein [Breznakiella homolactica]|uniref:Phage tail protein n=1 Tax=Breznakiella homolactica TaxID=2798577 RepID=A0A7T8BCG0_9SPIR|nr:hypothetical protein [Breznakiella homolactica]QQO10218.1 hypothetical protein JFL75_04660 [Breznakiella homolactica]
MAEMVKKHRIGLFINTGTGEAPAWKRVKKTTELTLSMNPQTQEYDYIADEAPTTELQRYAPQINQALTMYKGEDDFEFVYEKFFNLHTGNDAKVDVMIVFMFDEVTGETDKYRAWKSEGIMSISDMDAVNSVINFDLILNGSIQKGTAAVTAGVPVFTAA